MKRIAKELSIPMFLLMFSLWVFILVCPLQTAGQPPKPALKIPTGHSAQINTLAFSPDGKWIASGSTDNSLIIWDARTGFDIRKINTAEPVWYIIFPEDGSSVITVSGQVGGEFSGGKSTLKKWDLATGKLLGQYSYSGSPELMPLPSQDGFLIAENSSYLQKTTEQTRNMDLTDPNAVDKLDYSKLMNIDSMTRDFTKKFEELNKNKGKLDPNDKKAMEEYQRKLVEMYMGSYGGVNNVMKKSVSILNIRNLKISGKLNRSLEKAYTISYQGNDYIISPEMKILPSSGESGYRYDVWEIKSLFSAASDLTAGPWKTYPVKSSNSPVYTAKTGGFFAIPIESNSIVQLWQLDKNSPLSEFKVIGRILNRIEFSANGEVLYIFSQTADIGENEIYVEGWNTRTLKRDFLIEKPANYQSGVFRVAPSGLYYISTVAFPGWFIKQYNWKGDSTGVMGGRAGSPSYFGFNEDDGEVYLNFFGQPDLREYLLAATSASVEYEAFNKGTKLTKTEKDKLVTNQLKRFPFYSQLPYNGYNLVWDMTTGNTKIATASDFSPNHRTHSKDRDYTLRNLMYETGIVTNKTMTSMLRQPLDGVSEETMTILRKYYDSSSLFYKRVFAGRLNGPVTQLINNKTRDTISFIKIDSIDWITVLKNGYYMASRNAAKTISYVSGMDVYPFEQFDLQYNRPDKVLAAIGKASPTLIEAYHKAYLKRIKRAGIDSSQFLNELEVPLAEITNQGQIEPEQTKNKLSLSIKGSDKKINLDRFNVWVNEVPIFGRNGKSVRNQKTKSITATVELTLSEGMNRIEVSVMNMAGTESYRIPLYVSYSPAVKQKESLRFIGIGIDRFSEKGHDLQYSVKDIRDLSAKLKEKYGNDIQIDTLFNENVNSKNVTDLKKQLQQTSVNDKVILAYSGHGLLSKDFDYYLSTYTVNFNHPEQNGLPYDELENLLDSIPARRKLMLIDACHSGEVDKEEMTRITGATDSLQQQGTKGGKPTYTGKTTLGMKNSFELMQSLFVNVGKSTGATVISAAAGTQFALERGDLKNGVFTYSILEAMNKYPSIKISELRKIVGERVEKLTNGLQKPTSRNETIASDWEL